MKKLTKVEFLHKLNEAVHHAELNSEHMFPGWRVREGIDMAGLPLPSIGNLQHADEELLDNPIFRAVFAALTTHTSEWQIKRSPYYFIALAEAAWEHYQMPPCLIEEDGGRIGEMYIVKDITL